MERAQKTLTLTFLSTPLFLLALTLALVLGSEGIPSGPNPNQGMTPRPVCASQYALANYACAMIPYSPLPPPAPSTPSLEAHHHHRRRHHHHHHHKGSQEEEDCCRWLYEIDNDCVCEMLVRLPDFLSRPVHEYSLYVGDSCNVTYTCGGRVIRK